MEPCLCQVRVIHVFLLTIDCNTKLISAKALPSQKADVLKHGLWTHWFSHFGIPKSLISDQARNVDGTVIQKLCKELGIVKIRSSPYHPQGNGSAERAIGSLKTTLRSMCASRGISIHEWDSLLPEAVLATNASCNKSSRFSPFTCTYGEEARLPVDNFVKLDKVMQSSIDPGIIQENADLNRKEAQANYKRRHDKSILENKFAVGDEVLLKRTFGKYPKMNVKWREGPYKIMKKVGPVNWAISNAKGQTKVYHHDMLMPALCKQDAECTPNSATQPPVTKDIFRTIWIGSNNNYSQGQPENRLDCEGFQNNVFEGQNTTNNGLIQANPAGYTSSGRLVKPIDRLGYGP